MVHVVSLLNRSGVDSLSEVTLLDPDKELLTIAREQLGVVTDIPVTSITKRIENTVEHCDYTLGFDLIIASHLLYYVHQVEEVITKLYHALSPSGLLCTIARMSDADSFQIRKLFRVARGEDVEAGLSGERLRELAECMRLNVSFQIVVSHIEIPARDVSVFLQNAHHRALHNNATAWIIKLMGHSDSLIVPEELLCEVGNILERRTEGDTCRLVQRDGFIWIHRECAC
jgi:2-polyprenyl-3-methyl-5-hydroxy-6-metoxy-1,4-benzoquinol methylase